MLWTVLIKYDDGNREYTFYIDNGVRPKVGDKITVRKQHSYTDEVYTVDEVTSNVNVSIITVNGGATGPDDSYQTDPPPEWMSSKEVLSGPN